MSSLRREEVDEGKGRGQGGGEQGQVVREKRMSLCVSGCSVAGVCLWL